MIITILQSRILFSDTSSSSLEKSPQYNQQTYTHDAPDYSRPCLIKAANSFTCREKYTSYHADH